MPIQILKPNKYIYPTFKFSGGKFLLHLEATKPVDVYIVNSGKENEINFSYPSSTTNNVKYLGRLPFYYGEIQIPFLWVMGGTGWDLVIVNIQNTPTVDEYNNMAGVYYSIRDKT